MDNSIQTQVKNWYQDNGWTDLFLQKERFYAFPPHAVIPLSVPTEVIKKVTRSVCIKNLLFLCFLFNLIVVILNKIFEFSLWLSLVLVTLLSIFMLINELGSWLWFYKE